MIKRGKLNSLRLSVILSATSPVMFFDSAAFTVALPYLMKQFDIDQGFASLIPLSYTIGFAGSSLIFGRFCDAYGGKRVMVYSLIFYALLSFLGFLFTSYWHVVVIRFFLGVCGAAGLAAVVPLYRDTLPQTDMGMGYSVSGIVSGLSIVAGSVVEGLFLQHHFPWRFIYLLDLPFCLIAIFVVQRFLPDSSIVVSIKTKFDIRGIIYSSASIIFLVLALNLVNHLGWFSFKFNILLGLSLLFLALFIMNERETESPLLNWEIFGVKGFRYIVAVKMLTTICYRGMVYIYPFFIYIALSESVATVGRIKAFANLSFVAGSIFCLAVIDRFSSYKINSLFQAIRAIEYALILAVLFSGATIFSIEIIMVLFGISGAISSPATNKILTSYATAEHKGSVSSVNTMISSFSVTIGILLVHFAYTFRMPLKGYLNPEDSFIGTINAIIILFIISLITFLLSLKAKEKDTAGS